MVSILQLGISGIISTSSITICQITHLLEIQNGRAVQVHLVLAFLQSAFPALLPVLRCRPKFLVNTTCAGEYANYQHYVNHEDTCLMLNKSIASTPSLKYDEFAWGAPNKYYSSLQIVDYLLDARPSTAKADMQAAGLVLGLMPVILAYLGSNTVETGLLAMRRPLLAAILGLASPAVSPIRTFAYHDILGSLRKRISFAQPPRFLSRRPWLQNLLQYTAALVALTNLALVAMDLTRRTIIASDPNRDYQVTVWALWAFGIHVFGSAALMLRFRLELQPTAQTVSRQESFLGRIRRHINTEFTPGTLMSPSNVVVHTQPRNAWLWLILSWFVSIGTVVHIVFGTLIFSNILFIASGDALGVLMRCLASVSVCRIILMFELNEMGKNITLEQEGLVLESKVGSRVDDGLDPHEPGGPGVTVPATSYTRLVS